MNADTIKIKSDNSFEHEAKLSEIQSFYCGSTVFLTGATGFIGHLILEKLLRTCSGINKIYILIRGKRGKTTEERFKDIFDSELFGVLKQERPDFLEKISAVTGDCSLPNLGIEKQLLEVLKNEVNVIIHSAATVKFDEPLRTATNINVYAVQDLLKISKEMKNLKSYVHISTAYSNCTTDRKIMDEVFYKPHITGDMLGEFISNHSDDQISDATPTLLKNYPNTYTFTKAITEYEVLMKGEGLPVGIVRPSVVVGTDLEPIPGWTNNVCGPSGINAAVSVGLMRCMRFNLQNNIDLIPGDYVSNAVVACAWDIHKKWKDSKMCYETAINGTNNVVEKPFTPPIYNIVSSKKNPISWGRFTTLSKQIQPNVTSVKAIYHSLCILCNSKMTFVVLWFLLHTLPGFVVDVLAKLTNNKSPRLMEKFNKIHKAVGVLTYFTLNSWIFHDNNTTTLIDGLSKQDKSLFMFDAAKIDWDTYMKKYMIGIRTYIIKDPIETIPEGLKHRKKLLKIHYGLSAVLFFIFVFIIYGFFSILKTLNTNLALLFNL